MPLILETLMRAFLWHVYHVADAVQTIVGIRCSW